MVGRTLRETAFQMNVAILTRIGQDLMSGDKGNCPPDDTVFCPLPRLPLVLPNGTVALAAIAKSNLIASTCAVDVERVREHINKRTT